MAIRNAADVCQYHTDATRTHIQAAPMQFTFPAGRFFTRVLFFTYIFFNVANINNAFIYLFIIACYY